MSQQWSIDLIWWITAVELPVLGGLFWLVWRGRRDAESAIDSNRRGLEAGHGDLRADLAAYKLEVAKSYASIAYLKDVERRLTRHLSRIENKLDAMAVPAMGGRP